MTGRGMDIWRDGLPRQFVEVLSSISNVDEMKCLLRDVLTEKEIIEVSARLEAARLLDEGVRYTEIIESTKLSSRTVARVSDWRTNGCGGYAIAIDLLKKTTRSEVRR